MKRLFLLFAIIGLTACTSGLSTSDIQTAIAKTQAAQPTATPAPTATPVLTPTPTLTPTPALFTGIAKSYIPAISDMPNGFELNPTGSGPLSVEQGNGYSTSYSNLENAVGFAGDAFIVMYSLWVMPNISDAESAFSRISSGMTGPLPADFPFKMKEKFREIDDTEVPSVDDAKVFMGVIDAPLIPATAYVSVIRSANVVAQVFVVGNDDPDRRGILLSQSSYYVSLVTERLIR